MSAITQPRMNGREVVRCECGLIQFKSASGLCIKSVCRLPYVEPEVPVQSEPEPEIPVAPIIETALKYVENANFPVIAPKKLGYKARRSRRAKAEIAQYLRMSIVTPADKSGQPIGGLTKSQVRCLDELAKGNGYSKIAKTTGFTHMYVKALIRTASLQLGMAKCERVTLAIWWGCELFRVGVDALGLIGESSEQAA